MPISRRCLLKLSAAACLAARLPVAAAALSASRPRELWITRPEAQEAGRLIYWADGALQPEGYRAINRLYRDLHAGLEHPIALELLDLNLAMQSVIALQSSRRPLVLLSGFRTAATNRLVGGVEPSEHESGRADDFIFDSLSLADNIRLALQFAPGGLGIYPDRGSLHKDLGRRRTWVQYGRS